MNDEVKDMAQHLIDAHWEEYQHEAKRHALITVNEIIKACEYNMVESYNTDWWNKVKQVIEQS